MSMTRYCYPPAATVSGTYHWLQDGIGRFTIARWQAGEWLRVGSETVSTPTTLERLGFDYVGLASRPRITVAQTRSLSAMPG
jgi:hypothetical protein